MEKEINKELVNHIVEALEEEVNYNSTEPFFVKHIYHWLDGRNNLDLYKEDLFNVFIACLKFAYKHKDWTMLVGRNLPKTEFNEKDDFLMITKDDFKDDDTFEKVMLDNFILGNSNTIKKSYFEKVDPEEFLPEELMESIMNEEKKKVTSEDISDFIEDIYDLRKSSISTEGEYGLGNLVFKEFRNLGYLDNLRELKNKVKSKELSLENLE